MVNRRSVRISLFATGTVIVLGGIVFCLAVGSLLTAPQPAAVTLPHGFAGTEVSFHSGSGATLKGNLLPGRNGAGVVILMHGVRGNRGAMAKHASFLNKAGFSVLIFDFQAHGESTGSKITSGYLESKDAAAAVNYIHERFPAERVGIIGSSLGGAAAILAEPPLKIEAAVVEMVYPDITRAAKNRIEIVLGAWARPLSWLLTIQLKPRIGVGADWFSPVLKIKNLHCAKLIIGGGIDQHTKLTDIRELFEYADEPKELWIVMNAGHEDIHAVAEEEYERKIVTFFQRHLKIDSPESRPGE